MKEKKYYIYQLSMPVINTLAVIITIVLAILTPVLINKGLSYQNHINEISFGIGFLCFIGYCVLHEILHGIGYYVMGGKWNKIVFGIKLELGVFYCLCKQNIKRKNILVSVMLPLLILSIFTYILSVIFNLPGLYLLSIINLGGCAGDIVTFLFISKIKDVEFSEMDDATSFALYTSEDISKIKHFGLKYIECKDKIEREDMKKITVSKKSYATLAILIVIAVLLYVLEKL